MCGRTLQPTDPPGQGKKLSLCGMFHSRDHRYPADTLGSQRLTAGAGIFTTDLLPNVLSSPCGTLRWPFPPLLNTTALRPCSPPYPQQSRPWDKGRGNVLHTELLSKPNAPKSACRQGPWQPVGLSSRAKAQGFSPWGRPKWLAHWVCVSMCRESLQLLSLLKGVCETHARSRPTALAELLTRPPPSPPLEAVHGDSLPRGLKSVAWRHGICYSAGTGLPQLSSPQTYST